jgi:GNAT superfamily N-acetyltransferase
MITENFQEALTHYLQSYPGNPFFKTWVPSEKFLSCQYDSAGNFSISREDGDIYGIAIGMNPMIDEKWKKFSLDSRAINNLPTNCEIKATWDAYWAPSHQGDRIEPSHISGDHISEFLRMHAPESSVFPGDLEIQMWVDVVRSGELLAVAALCRWESGELVISSVATHTDFRGIGVGRELMNKSLVAAHQLGAAHVSLGVRHENLSAQRLYASSGFHLMHNFTYCERR